MKIEKYLTSGETVKYVAKASKAPVIASLVVTVILLSVGLIMFNIKVVTVSAIGGVIFLVSLVFVVFTVGQLEIVIGTWVILTDKRVIMHRGMLRNIFSEISLDKISGITIDQSLFGRICDYSTVIVESSAAISGIKTPFIHKPFEFKKFIQDNAEKYS